MHSQTHAPCTSAHAFTDMANIHGAEQTDAPGPQKEKRTHVRTHIRKRVPATATQPLLSTQAKAPIETHTCAHTRT
jgi:hypothetical protein